jgi:CubicO group peptidase (beta-lactamase class C family)
MIPQPPDYQGPKTFYDFLVKLEKHGAHGEAFSYKTANAEVLAWIIKRASGQSMADLLSSMIWQKLGAESDAYFMVDSIGTESGGGGLNATLRDLARFGEMIRNKGRFNGLYIDPKAEMVIVRYASHPVAANAANDPVTLPAFMAMAKELMK